VLRFQLNGSQPFSQVLRQTRETALAAYAHQDLPFEQLVEALQPERHLSHSPLFQVMFVLQNTPAEKIALEGLLVDVLEVDIPAAARFDLTLNMTEQNGRLKAIFEFNADLFEHDSIERLSRHFHHLLEAIIDRPDDAVAELPLLSDKEQHQLLIEWNRTHAVLPLQQTIHALFEDCAGNYPHYIAVVFEQQRLSYAELNAKANRLAHYLRTQGVGADELVGICIERSLDMIVAVLGVLKAGGAYLPLDPTLPQARMRHMLEDARPCLLLTQAHLLERLPDTAIKGICVDRDTTLLATWPEHNPVQQTRPDHLAYIIYTSGSTGKPKGTLIHHRGLVNLVLAQQQAFDLYPGKRVLQWASFNFDASVSEIFTALTAAARLYMASGEAVLPGQNLLDTLRRHHIELVTLTPSSLSALPVEPLPELKTLVVAGEDCDHALIAPWVKHYTVINAYGPTEATVCATVYPCSDDGQRHPPIGRPIANTQTYILDGYLHPVPIGVTGELYIGGEGLARGYLGRPDLTAERFIQNPFSEQPGARMYQTGDLARYLADGHIEYVGRIDQQVKIRGYRIELGELEFALSQLPSVHEAVVLAQDTPAGGRQLVAYVVLHANLPETNVSASSALRTAMHLRLPDYMVPAHFVFLDQLPLNSNGKIDRNALVGVGEEKNELTYAPPCTPIQEELAEIWCTLLARKQIGRNDNFFHIGGHSLLAVQLMARINDAFRLSLPLSQLFLSPTIAMLAAAIDARQSAAQLVVPLKQGSHAAPIWLIHPAGGTVFCYRKLADKLDADRPVYAIQSPEIAGLASDSYHFDMLCRRYAEDIVRLQPDGSVYLAGWSMGGALSFGIAQILEEAGRDIGWVGMFDTMLTKRERPQRFEEFVEWVFTRVQSEAFMPGTTLESTHARATQYIDEYGIEHLAQRLSINPDCLTDELGLDAHYVTFLQKQYEIQQAHVALMADFAPSKIHAPLHIFHAEESTRQGTLTMNWLAHTNDRIHSTQQTLPGHHENLILLEDNLDKIVQVLQKEHSNYSFLEIASWEALTRDAEEDTVGAEV
jgi:amino acid adenylation domain-containing protein